MKLSKIFIKEIMSKYAIDYKWGRCPEKRQKYCKMINYILTDRLVSWGYMFIKHCRADIIHGKIFYW